MILLFGLIFFIYFFIFLFFYFYEYTSLERGTGVGQVESQVWNVRGVSFFAKIGDTFLMNWV